MSELTFTATGSNDGPALQAALSAMTPSDRLTITGNAVVTPYSGMPSYTGVGGSQQSSLLLMAGGSIRFAKGASLYCPATPAGVDAFCKQPPLACEFKAEFENFQMTSIGGRDGLVICTANNGQMGEASFSGGFINLGGGSGFALHGLNDHVANPNGGIFDCQFEKMVVFGGTRWDYIGDTNAIRDCDLSGPKCSIDVSFVVGASCMEIHHNSLTGLGGSLLVRNGANLSFTNNNCETSGAYDYTPFGGRGFLVDFNGSIGTIESATVAGNTITPGPGSGIQPSGYIYLLAFTNAAGTTVNPNRFNVLPNSMNPAGAAILLYKTGYTFLDNQTLTQYVNAPIYDFAGNAAIFRVPVSQWTRV